MTERTPIEVPASGLLIIGGVYVRADLHERFGGNNTAGIVPSLKEPFVLLFHTYEPSNQFYEDGFDEYGVYLYSGQGAFGDMKWNSTNRAVRDHRMAGKSLLFFERYRRTGGLWELRYQMMCIGVRELRKRDKIGQERNVFMFELLPVSDMQAGFQGSTTDSLPNLRRKVSEPVCTPTSQRETLLDHRARSEAIWLYANARASGKCEACGLAAPFSTGAGKPYLEVHYLFRQADRGPANPNEVAALCPNCHRRCHYGADATEFNTDVTHAVQSLERDSGQSK